MLITFEGGEGAGKSTLIRQAAAFFEEAGHQVVLTREPGGTALGAKVRELVLKVDPSMQISFKAELMLYLASRAQTVEEIIIPNLLEGKIILCDRFNDSTLVYQGAARGLDVDQIEQLCEYVCGDVKPDLTFYLDVEPTVGLKRTLNTPKEQSQVGEVDRIEKEELSFHQKVRAAYLAIAKKEPQRVVVLDGNKSIDEVWAQAREVLAACLKS